MRYKDLPPSGQATVQRIAAGIRKREAVDCDECGRLPCQFHRGWEAGWIAGWDRAQEDIERTT